jgi:probable addiction module antidote protein
MAAKLVDPKRSARYLNAALQESPEMFLKALRKVAESHQMAKVAEDAGVTREHLYRITRESGNPTYSSLGGILRALGLTFVVQAGSDNEPVNQSVRPVRTGGMQILAEISPINDNPLLESMAHKYGGSPTPFGNNPGWALDGMNRGSNNSPWENAFESISGNETANPRAPLAEFQLQ